MIDITQEEIMRTWGIENCDKPLVSVRCITYNQQDYIHQSLDGFLMQKTTFPFEVIVHDDASTDKTAEVIRKYEAKFPKIVKPIYETENQYSKHDGSLGRIVNAACKGKYIALCEGDDYWIDENKLQMQVDFLENNPEYTMCFHKAKIKKELDVRCELKCDLITDRDYSAFELFHNWIVPTASICIRKYIFDKKIKNPHKILNGDIVIVEKAAHSGKVRGFGTTMSVYRVQSSGVTYDEKLQHSRSLAYPDHFLTLRENFPRIRGMHINLAIFNTAMYVYTNIDRDSKWLRKAFIGSPTYFVFFALRKIILNILRNFPRLYNLSRKIYRYIKSKMIIK